MSNDLTLNEAADELGVHYMTAYRYVRTGMLEAAKSGGAWRVTRDAIDRFVAGAATGPVARGRRAPWSARLESRLLAGDARGAWEVIDAAMAAGAGLEEVYVEVLSPAMVSIGDRWHRGEIDVAIEHRASGIATRVVGRLGHRFARRGRSRGLVIVGSPAGEHHGLSVAILGDLLRLRGWEVSDLGADVPTNSFRYALSASPEVCAVGLSVSSPQGCTALHEACAAIRAVGPDLLVVLGGREIIDDDHARSFGADAYASGGVEFDQLLGERLAARGRGPGRSSAADG